MDGEMQGGEFDNYSYEAFDPKGYDTVEVSDRTANCKTLILKQVAGRLREELAIAGGDLDHTRSIMEAMIKHAYIYSRSDGYRLEDSDVLVTEGMGRMEEFTVAQGGVVASEDLARLHFTVSSRTAQLMCEVADANDCSFGDVVTIGMEMRVNARMAHELGRRVTAVLSSGDLVRIVPIT